MVLESPSVWMSLISRLLSVFTGSLAHSWPAHDESASVTSLIGVDCGGICAKSWSVSDDKNISVFFHSLTIKL